MPRAAQTKSSDAISLLRSDHRKVEELFERYEKSKSNSVKASIAGDICLELSVHTTVEEELFYPAIRGTVDEEIYNEAYVEHDGAKVLIAEILAGSPADDFYDAKVKVLAEMIKHHVKEEEQRGGLFAQAKDDGDVDLAELGATMAARKKALTAQMKTTGVPRPTTRSMAGLSLRRTTPVA